MQQALPLPHPDLERDNEFASARRQVFTPTREAALDRLGQFVPRAGSHYARRRNFDLGPEQREGVSLLSPYVRHRLVLETEVLEAVLAEHSASAAEKFVQEVCWRTYWKGWLEMRPSVWRAYRGELQWRIEQLGSDASLRQRYESAIAGETGLDPFDSWTRELISTGYLHNHARMWFASLWVYTLDLPWVLGADFFYRHLLDGDPASNTLSWRWVCGLHTHGKTYLARPDNIARFTAGRFQPDRSQLAAEAHALEGPPHPSPTPVPEAELDWNDGARRRCALLVTEEDMHPESWPVHGEIAGAAGLTSTRHRSPLRVGALAREFARQAMHDALQRFAARRDGVAAPSSGDDRSLPFDPAKDLLDHPEPDQLVAWCRDRDVDHLVTAWAPVGPVAEVLDELRPALLHAGIELSRLRRPWDDAAWPHATRGFFAFKRRIPGLLESHVG
ncbi:MAG: DNA photolyase [Acidobacteria bacterium]|nr:MAG: DNA photolyase [Acidobacteriota bacterium]REK08513.1 MAG: DNA photolyase [Acidobacteriota bacterium]